MASRLSLPSSIKQAAGKWAGTSKSRVALREKFNRDHRDAVDLAIGVRKRARALMAASDAHVKHMARTSSEEQQSMRQEAKLQLEVAADAALEELRAEVERERETIEELAAGSSCLAAWLEGSLGCLYEAWGESIIAVRFVCWHAARVLSCGRLTGGGGASSGVKARAEVDLKR